MITAPAFSGGISKSIVPLQIGVVANGLCLLPPPLFECRKSSTTGKQINESVTIRVVNSLSYQENPRIHNQKKSKIAENDESFIFYRDRNSHVINAERSFFERPGSSLDNANDKVTINNIGRGGFVLVASTYADGGIWICS